MIASTVTRVGSGGSAVVSLDGEFGVRFVLTMEELRELTCQCADVLDVWFTELEAGK